jgi:hypothetical protein
MKSQVTPLYRIGSNYQLSGSYLAADGYGKVRCLPFTADIPVDDGVQGNLNVTGDPASADASDPLGWGYRVFRWEKCGPEVHRDRGPGIPGILADFYKSCRDGPRTEIYHGGAVTKTWLRVGRG